MKRLRTLVIAGITLEVALGVGGQRAGAIEAKPSSGQQAPTSKPSGAQLWAQNCTQCHTMRSPAQYSDREWGLITHQMRVRANLTKEEYEAIRKYLSSGN